MEDNQSSVWKSNESGQSTANSNPELDKSFSDFADWECGEQFRPQHLVLDFTPSEEVDTDFVQKKCCAFWDFVHNCPEFQDLTVMPEVIQFGEAVDSSISEKGSEEKSVLFVSFETVPSETPALSALKTAENKGIIQQAFEVELHLATCQDGSGYLDDDSTAAVSHMQSGATLEGHTPECTCNACRSCKNKRRKGTVPTRSTTKLKYLCKKMQDWDRNHPKSMEPPGPPPAPKHCVMQRLERKNIA